MFRLIAGAFLASLLAVTAAQATERSRLGYGRLVTNDYFGDGKDRWRTGSVTSSRVWGPEWTGQAPGRFGDLIELRLSAEVLAPDDLRNPGAGDRPYAGSLSVGAHTHYTWQGLEMAVGADLVMVGPATGLGKLQRELHDLFNVRQPSDATLDAQISEIRPTLVAEMGRSFQLAEGTSLRPFLEARAGAETLLRAGFDLTFGQIGGGELLVRENATGQRYRVIQRPEAGTSFVLGADFAHVANSIYLPEDRGYALTSSRDRVRAGFHWQRGNASAFYGLTWLGKEFVGQADDQLVGSLRINLDF